MTRKAWTGPPLQATEDEPPAAEITQMEAKAWSQISSLDSSGHPTAGFGFWLWLQPVDLPHCCCCAPIPECRAFATDSSCSSAIHDAMKAFILQLGMPFDRGSLMSKMEVVGR